MHPTGIGIWSRELRFGDAAAVGRAAAEIEELGYTAAWIPGGTDGPLLERVEDALAATERLTEYPGRFLLGLGISHAPLIDALVARGVAIKEEMWGPEHGRAKMERTTDFNREFEELVAKYCFAEVWGREQLPRSLRSMLTIAMLVALGRSHEVRIHVEAAISNGVTKEQIREILIHSAIYCGVPAAVGGFRNAMEILDQLGVE
jgi:4-carboxymuconolactone decarboxylase